MSPKELLKSVGLVSLKYWRFETAIYKYTKDFQKKKEIELPIGSLEDRNRIN